MAYWQRTASGRVKVYTASGVYVPKRGVYEHLDTEPDWNVDAWVRNWELGAGERGPGVPTPVTDSTMRRHVEEYLAYLTSRGKSPKTVGDHGRMLHTYILPYFLGVHDLQDPNQWLGVSAKLAAWMRGKGQSEHQILKANSALRGFWEWMSDEQLVLPGAAIRVRAPVQRETATPLGRVVEPPEVLAWARSCTRVDVRLMGLLGYFFSLRPQEVFAVKRAGFRAGSAAAQVEACRIFARHALFGRLAYEVTEQRRQDGEVVEPKAYSRGWVACFDAEAARLVVDALREFEPGATIFEYLPDWGYEIWSRHGIRGITLKDLRRASIYWLGHHTQISDVMHLMKHARHRKVETTLRYLRRPTEEVEGWDELDLDA